MGKEIFKNRKLVIATKHQKEEVIAPLVASELQVEPFVIDGLDTDLLGTFTGEIERKLDPLSTARAKCHMAMELSGCDLAIASEGSFGMHPFIPFLPSDDELVVLVDRRHQLEIVGRNLTVETNFNGREVINKQQLEDFAQKAGFPSHGLIIRNARNQNLFLKKGIVSRELLYESFDQALKEFGNAFVETDMRAFLNPTRMKAIQEATRDLLKRAARLCPDCSAPGFGITGHRDGLPCSLCGAPTRSVFSYIYTCNRCGYSEEIRNPEKEKEDPTYCDYCNP
ncbi:DUF6671 family protein [Prolixibacter denitrificans]|jgi:ribosomal protein S27AE|uniref:DUF6671 domain-containing protein n=1 Tax=Prolixibacter denitrificans TaxID=1541063 RepID=A0A2P8CAP4_9BACT|nr:DUF6671 family protein [Prolixibacter denitrificans]PSK82026.1 hypothetical protein CLV93_107140 [Prolixibacter denitrificans]GET22618.1 hypothetical protein JCM18694_28640 [Prolixibacter denitrificans]